MEFDTLIQERRSVRAYQSGKTVDRDTVMEILRATQLAPTWKNSQTGRYYVVQSADKLAQVKADCLPSFNQKSSANASALIATTFVKNVAGHTNGQPDNELGNEWGAYDLGLQNSYLVLKARDLGLDTLIMGIRDADALRRELGIPSEEEVVSVLALGYREGEPAFRPRKVTEEIVRFF